MAYKMKGFSGFGKSPAKKHNKDGAGRPIVHNPKSPAKVSDDKLLSLQSKLNHSELDYREPGWAKVAGKAHGAAMGAVKGALGGDKSEPAKPAVETGKDVAMLEDEVAPLDGQA